MHAEPVPCVGKRKKGQPGGEQRLGSFSTLGQPIRSFRATTGRAWYHGYCCPGAMLMYVATPLGCHVFSSHGLGGHRCNVRLTRQL